MLKKLGKTIKLLMVGTIWTYLYVSFANLLTYYFWNFDFLNPAHWELIQAFWNKGGSISSGREYGFALTIILIIPLWLTGFYVFYKINYVKTLLFPIIWYNQKMINKYGRNTKRIILKNIGIVKKIDINELIEERMQQSKPTQTTNVAEIRQSIQEKLDKTKK